ncbi:DUF2256 domain-containing protein [Chromohalobacter israelensis]|uniref:DUF2256 domain-containing protein n=1 Tax=Chromohalobacter israelensis TaxID=141390 RepID=UPI003D799EE7
MSAMLIRPSSGDVLMPHRKPHLPTKICPVCQRPFAWRKKWARDWENVVYCSARCRREKVSGE